MSNATGRSLIGKILFVIGVIIILIVLAFLIIRFVPKIFGGLANVGSSLGGVFGNKEIVINTSDSSLQDGDKFTINWNHKSDKPGSYNITYDCIDTLSLDIITNSGTKRLICNNVFTLGPNVSNASLVIHLTTKDSFADVPIKISFTENGDSSPVASGETIVTVQNGNPSGDLSSATIESEPVSNTDSPAVENLDGEDTDSSNNDNSNDSDYVYVTGGSNVSAPSGQADLAISNLTALGNQVVFTVANIGGKSSGNWIFNYSSPTTPTEIATSPLQISLAPGQAIRYTLTFSDKDSGNQSVTVAVDPFNTISERSESNNIASVTLSGSSFGGGSNFNNYQDNDQSNDRADFVIDDLEIGYLSGSQFRNDSTVFDGDDIAIRFTVRNKGDRVSDEWRFEIDDTPYKGKENDYKSQLYRSLRPGEKIEIVIEFENIDEGTYRIEVNVDSEDDTREEDESNNDANLRLKVED